MPKHYFSNYLLAVSQNIPFQNICCVCLQEVGCCLCFKFRSKALWSIHPWALLQGSYWDTQLLKMLFLFILLLLRMEHLCCKSRGDEKEHYHFTEVSWQRYNMISEPHSLSNGLKTEQYNSFRKGTNRCFAHTCIIACGTFPFLHLTKSQLQDKMMRQRKPCTNVFSIITEWADSGESCMVKQYFLSFFFLDTNSVSGFL